MIGSDQILHIFKEKANRILQWIQGGAMAGSGGREGGEESGVTQKFLA